MGTTRRKRLAAIFGLLDAAGVPIGVRAELQIHTGDRAQRSGSNTAGRTHQAAPGTRLQTRGQPESVHRQEAGGYSSAPDVETQNGGTTSFALPGYRYAYICILLQIFQLRTRPLPQTATARCHSRSSPPAMPMRRSRLQSALAATNAAHQLHRHPHRFSVQKVRNPHRPFRPDQRRTKMAGGARLRHIIRGVWRRRPDRGASLQNGRLQ